MSRVFGALLNRISKFKPNAQFDRDSIERFNYAASRFKTIEDLDDRITRDPRSIFERLHQSLCEAGFRSKRDAKDSDIIEACSQGDLSCEHASFLYLALLNGAGLDLSSSLANTKFAIVSLFNPRDSHVALAVRDQPNWIWETTLLRDNQQAVTDYERDFDYIQANNIRDVVETLTALLCLDLVKKTKPELYLPSILSFETSKVSYPSNYFYSIEIINQLADEISNSSSLSMSELRPLCAQAIKRLRTLKSCPYLRKEDIEANIDWFRNQGRIRTTHGLVKNRP